MANRLAQGLKGAVQDMPPPGGYPEINIKRRTPARGPSGLQIWLGFTAVVGYGFYQLGQHNQRRNADKMEKREAKLNLAPFLQAESDWRWIKEKNREMMREGTLMKDNKDWVVGKNVYVGYDDKGNKIWGQPFGGVNASR